MKILAIDDHRDNLTTLTALISEHVSAAEVHTALSGPLGLALAAAEDPDVILLDVLMPGMDGYAVCEEIKASEALRDIPVVFVTALGTDVESRRRAIEVGADGFLAKPVDEIELIAQIRAMAKIKTVNRVLHLEKSELANLVAERTIKLEQELHERKQIEQALRARSEELERSNIELERFAYVASHDLREPLRMVTSYTQLLKKRYGGQLDAEADDFIGYAVEGATRMEALIQALLAYSCVGSQGREFCEANLGSTLDDVLKGLEVAIAESQAVLTCDDELPVVNCDASQIGQVFQNLIANAIRFRRDEPPRIHLGVKLVGEEWVFSIEDNGLGIEDEYYERIFVIFRRLQPRDKYEGSGMGLAICKRIVERHHGRIWVESSLGQGSTFYFSLPA